MKINFFDVLDKYKYSKGKCVKSVLAEFSSGDSVLRNKGNQSDLGTPFCPPPRPGGTGALPPALSVVILKARWLRPAFGEWNCCV